MRAVDQQHWPTPEELMEYVDGEGVPAARRDIASHLASCAACRAIVDEQHGLTQQMQAWTTDGAPRSLQPPARPASWWKGWSWQPRAVMVSLSAAAVVLVVVSMNVGTLKRRTAGAPTTVALSPAAAPAAGPMREEFVARKSLVGGPQMDQSAVPRERTSSIIRTARLRIVAKDFDGVRPSVESIASSLAGFIDHLTVTGDTSTARQLRGVLRVPGDRLADALVRLRQLGVVIEDTQGSQDVSDQMVDLEARLANARATELRLTEILKNRTGRLSDVLEVEREVSRVRLEIERIDAEKTNLGRRVAYATIDVTIAEERKASIDGPLSLMTRLRLAALDGLEGAIESAAGAVLFVLRAGPTLVMWGTVMALAWAAWRRTTGWRRPRVSE
jgi:hypothetical protein